MNSLSVTALLATIIAVFVGFVWVAIWNAVEIRRLAKQQRDKLPKAKKYSKEVDRLLELDEYEQSISN